MKMKIKYFWYWNKIQDISKKKSANTLENLNEMYKFIEK